MNGVGRECTPAPERRLAGISVVLRNGGGKGCGKALFVELQSAPARCPSAFCTVSCAVCLSAENKALGEYERRCFGASRALAADNFRSAFGGGSRERC